jgi:hypothetical protein
VGASWASTDAKEIAERVGVTEPILFRHFGTKNALFDAMQPSSAAEGGNTPPLGRILKRFEKLAIWERQIHGFRPFDPAILSHTGCGPESPDQRPTQMHTPKRWPCSPCTAYGFFEPVQDHLDAVLIG